MLERLLRARRAIAAAGAILLALAAWLFLGRPAREEARLAPLRALVVDASASVVRRRPDWLPWIRAELAREARAAETDAYEVAVVVFAADVAVRQPPGPPEALLARLAGRGAAPLHPAADDDGASALADALELVEGFVPARSPLEVVLFGDGTWTGRDPAPALARLLAAGGSFARRAPPPPSRPDGAVVELALAPAVEVGAPLVATATVAIAPPLPASAALQCELKGRSGARQLEVPLDLAAATRTRAGDLALRVPIALGPARQGRTDVTARVVLAGGGDPIPENDIAHAATVAEGELVVGAVAEPAAREALAAWLLRDGAPALDGVQVLTLAPEELASALESLDVVVSFDTALERLPAPLLEPFVRRGGGWLALGGFGLLAGWPPEEATEREDSPSLAELLPMRPEPDDDEPHDVVLLVDGSGSMAGEPFDLVRAAAVELVAAAPPRDAIELRFFTRTLDERHVLREAISSTGASRAETREAAASRLLAARMPGGSTAIQACLEELARERERADREALVLLLTDGREESAVRDPETKPAELLARFRAARARLAVIAVGEDADRAFLSRFVPSGEELRSAATLSELELLFQREVNRSRVTEADGDGGIAVRAAPAEPGSLADELLVAGGALPALQRLVRSDLRDGASLLWESESGEPVLAVARAGLGRSALFASAPMPGWAPAWTAEVERFGPLLRWLGRDREHTGPSARVVEGDSGAEMILVEGLDAAWPPLVHASLVDPAGDAASAPVPLTLALAPLHPTDSGRTRRSAALPAAPRDAAAGRVLALLLEVPPGAAIPAGPLALALAIPPRAEFRADLPGAAGEIAAPADVTTERPKSPSAPRTAPEGHPAAVPLAALGVALLFLSGASRRLGAAVQARAQVGR